MSFKNYCFVLVTLLAVQGITEAKLRLDLETYNLVETFEDLVEYLNTRIEDGIIETTNQLNGIVNQLASSGNGIIEKSYEEIKDVVTSVSNDIDALAKMAEDMGCDITECVAQNMENIEFIPTAAAMFLAVCVNDQMQNGKAIMDNSTQLVKHITDDISDLEKEFHGCKMNVLCMTSVISKARVLGTELPQIIAKNITKAVRLINALVLDMSVCSAKIVTVSITDVNYGAEVVTNCIQGKMDEVKSTIY